MASICHSKKKTNKQRVSFQINSDLGLALAGWSGCVVFLGKALYSHSVSFHSTYCLTSKRKNGPELQEYKKVLANCLDIIEGG